MNLIIQQSKQINNTLKSILKLSQDHSSYVALLKSLQHEKASLFKQDSQLYTDMISNCEMIKWIIIMEWDYFQLSNDKSSEA